MKQNQSGSKRVSKTHQTPPRDAPRLEGVVKNIGIKPKKKKPKPK